MGNASAGVEFPYFFVGTFIEAQNDRSGALWDRHFPTFS